MTLEEGRLNCPDVDRFPALTCWVINLRVYVPQATVRQMCLVDTTVVVFVTDTGGENSGVFAFIRNVRFREISCCCFGLYLKHLLTTVGSFANISCEIGIEL